MEEIVYGTQPCLCVENVRATKDFQLLLSFSNGCRRVFDFKPMLTKAIYHELNNVNLFVKAETDGCGVVWNDELDIDPTYLFEHSREA